MHDEKDSYFKEKSREQQLRAKLQAFKKELSKGDVLCQQGDTGTELYILISGAITVSKDNVPIAIIDEEGTYFGELSVLLGIPRSATLTAMSDTSIYALPKDALPKMLKTSPELAQKLLVCESKRLHKTSQKLAQSQNELTREKAIMALLRFINASTQDKMIGSILEYARKLGADIHSEEYSDLEMDALNGHLVAILGEKLYELNK